MYVVTFVIQNRTLKQRVLVAYLADFDGSEGAIVGGDGEVSSRLLSVSEPTDAVGVIEGATQSKSHPEHTEPT